MGGGPAGSQHLGGRPMSVFAFRTVPEIDRMIAEAVISGAAATAELFRVARREDLRVCLVERSATVPIGLLKRAGGPVLVVLGDDDHASTGPDGFPRLAPLLRWANAATVHAAGADIVTYRSIAAAAQRAKRFLLVETDAAHAADWMQALARERLRFDLIWPIGGIQPCERQGEAP